MHKNKVEYKRVGKNRYKLKRSPSMKADAKFFANNEILPLVTRDDSLKQLAQTAELPDLVSPVLGMPDMHQGYGIPVGGIMVSEKIVSAGCVGMDINCGVRLIRCGVDYEDRLFGKNELKRLLGLIEDAIPMGVGKGYEDELKKLDFEKVLTEGARHVAEVGYGTADDLMHCEEEGRIDGALPNELSAKAKKRASNQVGTLGSGNHFLELQKVEEVYDEKKAETFGLYEGLVCFMIHSGSRALGHQTCLDYTKLFEKKSKKEGGLVPVKNLASAYVDSEVGKKYLGAMNASINFAFANRQVMTEKFRRVFKKYMRGKGKRVEVEVVYDVAHNSAKWEKHGGKMVLVHRKGATRAFPAGHDKNPETYKDTGHPALIPGSMGTSSYVVVGTAQADETFYSVNHGAGRAMSRTEAKKSIDKDEFMKQMGDVVFNKPYGVVADEAPGAYKKVEDVISVLEEIGITQKVARLSPLAVAKGN